MTCIFVAKLMMWLMLCGVGCSGQFFDRYLKPIKQFTGFVPFARTRTDLSYLYKVCLHRSLLRHYHSVHTKSSSLGNKDYLCTDNMLSFVDTLRRQL